MEKNANAAHSGTASGEAPEKEATRPIAVLLVEDNPDQCRAYEAELTREGYAVRVAHDGWEALAACQQAMPDIVVTDINMPGMDGIDAMERLIGKNNRIPIILYSSYAGYRDNYRSWSADAYLTKSADLTELTATIRRVLEARRHTNEIPGL